MASRSSFPPIAGAIVGLVLVAGAILACGPSASSGGGTSLPSMDVTAQPSPTAAGRDAPPDALLGAEGGDPVTGQLGTFTWLRTGSDSPWLTGAPLVVGAGEPLTVQLVPDSTFGTWAARYVPAAAQGPDGATTLADGTGSPAFDAPGPGAWTVEVFVEFAAGVGDARYFWRLEVN